MVRLEVERSLIRNDFFELVASPPLATIRINDLAQLTGLGSNFRGFCATAPSGALEIGSEA